MRRATDQLAGRRFDLLIVGGGIHGAALLREAALQGWSAALIERDDFGGATSANSLKVIHGGLRYLQHGDVARARQAVMARRRFLRLAPHLVRPLPCVLPTYRRSKLNGLTMAAALALNDLLSRDRNEGVEEEFHLPGGRLLSRSEILRIAPGVPQRGLSGGALWYDCLVENTERLTLAFVTFAVRRGAEAANYVEAQSYVFRKNRVEGVRAKDRFSGAALTIEARVVVDATGPWLYSLPEDRSGESFPGPLREWAMAANLVVGRPLFESHAVGLSRRASGRGGQVHFFVPWQAATLIGTWCWRHTAESRKCFLREDQAREMVDDVNALYPSANLRPEEVSLVHLGLLPLEGTRRHRAVSRQLRGRARLIDYEKGGGPGGLIGIEGVKYTTSVSAAEEAVLLAAAKLGTGVKPLAEAPPLVSDFPGGSGGGAPDGLPGDTIRHLRTQYGELCRAIFDLIEEVPQMRVPLIPAQPTILAEVIHAVRHEMAYTLADVIFRRTGLGTAGHPGAEVLERCAAVMGAELQWDRKAIKTEIAAVEEVFRERSLSILQGKEVHGDA